jgi:hypothetical protein
VLGPVAARVKRKRREPFRRGDLGLGLAVGRTLARGLALTSMGGAAVPPRLRASAAPAQPAGSTSTSGVRLAR